MQECRKKQESAQNKTHSCLDRREREFDSPTEQYFKKYKTADWAKLGHKTRVSNRPRAKLDNPESYEYYKKHFGVNPQW